MNQQNHPTGTILIVDDTPENLDVLIAYLEQFHFRLLVAKNGRDMLKRLDHITPDLILLDVVMPGMDGFEACRQLKRLERLKAIPIIFMSALADTVNKVTGFEVGGVDYITKPFQHEEVFARIKAHLLVRQQQQYIVEQNAALEQQSLEALQLNTQLHELNAQLQQEIAERKQTEALLAEANWELQRLAALDGLTQVANRRRFDAYLHQEWKRSIREQTPLSVIMCDIDYFKDYNDTYGHLAGDDCLKQVAHTLLRSAQRPADLVARYGGEEFCLILPHTDQQGGAHVAHRIQAELRQLALPHSSSSVSSVITLSIGVATTTPSFGPTPEALVNTADKALYDAKGKGRNTVVLRTLSQQNTHSGNAGGDT